MNSNCNINNDEDDPFGQKYKGREHEDPIYIGGGLKVHDEECAKSYEEELLKLVDEQINIKYDNTMYYENQVLNEIKFLANEKNKKIADSLLQGKSIEWCISEFEVGKRLVDNISIAIKSFNKYKKTIVDVEKIKKMSIEGNSIRKIALIMGITKTSVHEILSKDIKLSALPGWPKQNKSLTRYTMGNTTEGTMERGLALYRRFINSFLTPRSKPLYWAQGSDCPVEMEPTAREKILQARVCDYLECFDINCLNSKDARDILTSMRDFLRENGRIETLEEARIRFEGYEFSPIFEPDLPWNLHDEYIRGELKRGMGLSLKVAAARWKEGDDCEEIVRDFIKGVEKKVESFTPKKEEKTLALQVHDKNLLKKIPLCVEFLDQYVPLKSGELILLLGRTGIGKTNFSSAMAVEQAKSGYRILYFSCEMNKVAIGEGFLSWYMKKGKKFIRDLNKTKKDHELFVKSSIEFEKRVIISTTKQFEKFESEILKVIPDIVYIDYAEFIECEGQGKMNTADRLIFITKELSSMATRLDIPIVLLAQANRDFATGDQKISGWRKLTPKDHHIAGSDMVGKTAHRILSLGEGQGGMRFCHVVKNRHDPNDKGVAFKYNFEEGTIEWLGNADDLVVKSDDDDKETFKKYIKY